MVEQHRDVLAFDFAGGDGGVGDGLVHAERGAGHFMLVVGLAGGAGLGVGGDVGGARRTRPAAGAGEGFEVLALLQRHAGLAVGERFLGGLVGVEVGVHLHHRLAGPERLGEHLVDAGLHPVVVAFLGGLLAAGAAAGFAVLGGPQQLPGAVGDRHLLQPQPGHGGGDELGDAAHRGGAQRAGAR